MISTLPDSLESKLVPGSLRKLNEGRLGNCLFHVTTMDSGPCYLKIGTGDAAVDMGEEVRRLHWIGNRLPVPQALFHETIDGVTYLLITEIQGKPSHEYKEVLYPQKVVESLALTLRQIHELPINECPFNTILEDELAESNHRVQKGLLDRVAFVSATGQEPETLLEELENQRYIVQDLVFTHGDYALPNVIMQDNTVTGIVDWGIAGIADKHRDFMCIEKSINRNLGPEWTSLFYDEYGETEVDVKRIQFYWQLDQYYAHYKPVDVAASNKNDPNQQ